MRTEVTEPDVTTGELELEERNSLRRVTGLSTELADISEVEYRQLRLERVVLVGVWTEGGVSDAEKARSGIGVKNTNTFATTTVNARK